jgi:hypothetical protein
MEQKKYQENKLQQLKDLRQEILELYDIVAK